jgi:predicted CXXCH cytochrome family protein
MAVELGLLILSIITVGVLLQVFWALDRRRYRPVAAGLCLLLPGGWLVSSWCSAPQPAADKRIPSISVTSENCAKCHESHYQSWRQTYHRTMTREATAENVKGDFADATFTYHGIATRLTHDGNSFYMDTIDPRWAAGHKGDSGAAAPHQKFKIDRLVGSHWFQECLHKDDAGRYWRMPVSYHIVEQRWIHTNGAFLAPDTDDFWSKSTLWNETCVFCHNTKPAKHPIRSQFRRDRLAAGYETEVSELGIACEACHGAGGYHVEINHNPARRLGIGGNGDWSIVNPRRLSVERANEICAHCHGSPAPRWAAWDPASFADPYDAGESLSRTSFFFWSEREQREVLRKQQASIEGRAKPDALDGRFWGDGTPLTTALEYQGMALSACAGGGHGPLSCLSCHQMHPQEPNFMLAPRMLTNEACYQCHDSYRARVTEHTHHPADSPGSLCYNCHMPYQVYSLLTTHRSHRIEALRIEDSLGTGKPHACNLCHLDKSLGWSQEWLGKWYQRAPVPLSPEERTYSSALLHLCRSDARSRAVVAGAFSWPAAQRASGRDWAGALLPQMLEHERFPAVRYLAHRGLRSMYGRAADGYDYLALPLERSQQLQRLREALSDYRPAAAKYPYLPLDAASRFRAEVLDRLLKERNDPDVEIHE